MKKFLLIAVAAFMTLSLGAQQKFAHVNFSELVQLCPEADKARETMEASQKEAEEVFQSMTDEFETKYRQYEAKASTWTAAIRDSKEKELRDIQTRIQEYNQQIGTELQQQQNQLMAPIYTKVNETIQSLAKKGGYIYVFDKSSALYIDDAQSTDLTPEARTALGIPADRTLESLQAELQAKAAAQQQAAQ